MNVPRESKARHVLCLGFFIAASIYHLFAVAQAWERPIADFNPWRQSQTAITAWYFLHEGFSLAYPVPVLGPPWSIPFEFPVYQALVAVLAGVAPLPFESCGRLVSLFAFYSTLPAVSLLLKRVLGLGRERFFVLGFLLISPLYISWSRAFSIESTALALSLWYLLCFHRWITRPGPASALLLIGLGVLAALTKVTTFFAWTVATVPVFLLTLRPGPDLLRQRWRWLALTGLMAYLVPFLTAIVWTRYTDVIKASSPLTESLTSSALQAWNFGTLQQRLSLDTWRRFELFSGNLVCSRYNLLLAALCLAIFARHRKTVVTLGLLFVVPPLVFTNLYYAHDYYWYASGFFILIALGLAFLPLVASPRIPLAAGVIACMLILYQYRNTHNAWYGPKQRTFLSPALPLAGKIGEFVAPDDYCIVYGFDWDPTLAYHSRRRMIMETAEHRRMPLNAEPLASIIAESGRERLGAVVFVGEARDDRGFVEAQLRTLGISSAAAYEDAFGSLYPLKPSRLP